MKLSDLNVSESFQHAVFVGKPGSLKTVGASSWPKPYFFDFDNGLLPVKSCPWAGEVEYDMYDSVNMVEKKLREFEQTCPYKTLVFDSTTTLSHVALKHSAELNDHTYKVGDKKGQLMLDKIGILEYGQRITWMTSVLISLQRFPCNTIMICHEEFMADGNGIAQLIPAVPGKKFPFQVPGLAHEVWRFVPSVDGEGKLAVDVSTFAANRFAAKSRLGLKPMRFSFGESLYQKVLEQLKGRKEGEQKAK